MQLNVRPTDTRRPGDLLIELHPQHKATIGRWAVIARKVPTVTRMLESMGRTPGPQGLAIMARVAYDERVAPDDVRMDQKLRTAVGLDFLRNLDGIQVEVERLKVPLGARLRSQLNRFLGRRVMAVRAHVAFVPDIEMNLVRLSQDGFALLGCNPGDRIHVECIQWDDGFRLRTLRRRAYAASSEALAQRREGQSSKPGARYPDGQALLDLGPDLDPIFVDRDFNLASGAFPMAPMRVQRDAVQLMVREIRNAGFLFFLTALTLVEVLPLARDWTTFAVVAAGALVTALALTIVTLRESTS
ncbi:MAG: hypothetical protein ACPHID_04210 [Thermoplasmatota archaeon]